MLRLASSVGTQRPQSLIACTVRRKRTAAAGQTLNLKWKAASLNSDEAAEHIRWILTQRRDGQQVFKKVMGDMDQDRRRRIGLSWAIGELKTEFERADVNKDGVLTAEEFVQWGTDITIECPGEAAVQEATTEQLRRLFLRTLAPFIGFGFVDNALMVMSGEMIDAYLGAMFGISTMAAAALGNAFSNGIGMGLHGVIERAAASIGLKDPELTMDQMQQSNVHVVKTVGGILGIISGCLLGMSPLLFMNTKPSSHAAH
eukprot:TRINITY_DN16274_c0_g1_i10.p1 TRINITY_DN16274_c0_g1~~TRINITY_DN16274_c0_g1_i10.p1  ORF type:complete len:288 (-),score=42.28 TRINITY_DN16274_c0_g1_i10:422-1195(-)